ncbi:MULTISPECIES: MTH938/NDUFAF3 family protein [unclassified Methylophaga]|jgi:uncharacterized protein|uniref:MTH938/NDUFAF3 family protein n=1 Tax=unclassified Methylophaga TaxID=2629249 RepID=UPI000C9566B1|nr:MULTISPECIES: MTH938/NDUFAF3 family protein [unclassified Methylophaga]MAK67229.1 hypothetical protein [Methylophaga sp.]MAY18267.1 hypothetical protein [Methylophaga sp.]MBN47302.1 hypothetical protein [Methylophaga sp.]HAO24416.1 hypothetical protein [Methylophaga sp.]|tara:strand:- start:4180 stop:4566 length:387 start_codon:yes stop_codon:yes gene_type:complete
MKISQEAVTDALVIKSYGDGFLLIQAPNQPQQRITHNCTLSPEGVFDTFDLKTLAEKQSNTLIEKIKAFNADVIIMVNDEGITPQVLQITTKLAEHGISLETMSLGAACRTYNLLLNEGRKPIVLVSF